MTFLQMITLVLYVWCDVGDCINCLCLLCENQCVESVFLVFDKSDNRFSARKLCSLIESDPGWEWNNPPFSHCLVYWPFVQEILWSVQHWSKAESPLKEPVMQIFLFLWLGHEQAVTVTDNTIHCYANVLANSSPLHGEAFPFVVFRSDGPLQAREN